MLMNNVVVKSVLSRAVALRVLFCVLILGTMLACRKSEPKLELTAESLAGTTWTGSFQEYLHAVTNTSDALISFLPNGKCSIECSISYLVSEGPYEIARNTIYFQSRHGYTEAYIVTQLTKDTLVLETYNGLGKVRARFELTRR